MTIADGTPEVPPADRIGGGQASEPDAEALRAIQRYAQSHLPRVQAQADKWIGGLTALTGLLTVAVVVKGPDSFSKLADTRDIGPWSINPKIVVIWLMVVGGVLIGLGIYQAYSAAHGNPFDSELEELAWNPQAAATDGLDAKWRQAVKNTAKSASRSLRSAVGASIAGIACLALAVLLTWTTEEQSDSDGDTPCLRLGDSSSVIELAEVPTVAQGELTMTVVSCPE